MKTFNLADLSPGELNRLYQRPKLEFDSVKEQVMPIISKVRDQGDQAIHYFNSKFDKVEIDELVSNPFDLEYLLSETEKKAIDIAIRNVQRFHKEQMSADLKVETMPGIICSRVTRPIEKVGLYIPGGTAPLPSTTIMLGVPASIAGCSEIVIATPPGKNGKIPDSIIYIAQKIGAVAILKAGGAQAIAAMAYGTESVPKVDKIFGPGNQYVTAAKMILQNSDAMISIDLPAGPSEVLVVADQSADPEFVAADLLSQAEHGIDSQVVLVAIRGFDLNTLNEELNSQLNILSRSEIAATALDNSYIVTVKNMEEAMEFSNKYAPEHLIINCKDAESFSDKVQNAGSVFLGMYTPESLGDYASGTNHTLPTYGFARMYSGVSLNSFQKNITMQYATPEGLKKLGPAVEILASIEGLDAHKNAVSIRLKKLNEQPDQTEQNLPE
jgi:histidinol dehydrogenase